MAPKMLTNDDKANSEAEYIGGIIKRVSNFNPRAFESDLDERKKFQKTIYLIQAFDIPLGFSFNWYLHGVYCPQLADIGYQLANIYDNINKAKFKQYKREQRFQSFLEFIEPIKEDVLRLEASSSLHYVSVRNPDADKDMVIEFVTGEKDLGETPVELCEDEWDRLARFEVLD